MRGKPKPRHRSRLMNTPATTMGTATHSTATRLTRTDGGDGGGEVYQKLRRQTSLNRRLNRKESSMKFVSPIIKPTSTTCNIYCDYCYHNWKDSEKSVGA